MPHFSLILVSIWATMLLAVGHDVPQPVHLRGVAVPDHAALPDGKGRIVYNGLVNEGGQLLQRVQLLADRPERGRGPGAQQLL